MTTMFNNGRVFCEISNAMHACMATRQWPPPGFLCLLIRNLPYIHLSSQSIGSSLISLQQEKRVGGDFHLPAQPSILPAQPSYQPSYLPTCPTILPCVVGTQEAPEILAFGMLCAVTGAAVWLTVATYLELAVSTTHTLSECRK